MTREETKVILAVLKAGYPNFYKDMSADDAKNTVNLWSTMFSSEPAQIITEAVKALISTLKYPPTIADVKEKVALITQPQAMTEMEAWNLVKSAISYYHAKEGFDGLPPILQKLVGGPNQLREWATMEAEDVENVVKSNFLRSYSAKVKSEKELAALPESTKNMMQTLAEGFSMNKVLGRGNWP
jgi:hypothetical protein